MSDVVADRAAEVVVCIATHQRPASLAALLRVLAIQKEAPPFRILIGNNDAGDLRAYPELSAVDLPLFDVVNVATRGVSAVRNTLISTALASPSDVRWIAFLDDDQTPADDWLMQLVAKGVEYDADLVGGPVARTVAVDTFWSNAASDTSYLPVHSGPTEVLNEAGNLLIATRYLRSLDRLPFSLAFGLTGGEDYEFFLHAKSKRARMIWASLALVSEPLRNDRVTFRGFLSRFYTIAAYQTRADRIYFGNVRALARIGVDLVKCTVAVNAAVLLKRSLRIAVPRLFGSVAHIAGRCAGMMGARAKKYGHDDERGTGIETRS